MAVHREHAPTLRMIKRYANRKLYDVQESRYITLDGIRSLVRGGVEVRVVDNDTGEDLTKLTFAQIIYEEEKRKNGVLSLPLLRWMVERSDEAMRDFMRGVERGREALDNMREATEKRVHEIVEKSSDRSREFLEELINAPQRQLESLQHRIDEQVEKMTHYPAIQKELRRVEHGIEELEQQLQRLSTRIPAAKPPRKRARR